MPKTRVDFWTAKFEANVIRDCKVEQQLREMGWRVQVIWECETHDPILLKKKLRKMLSERPS
jgi:DNA mismatch endonuclease (patch repair protein)